MLDKNNFISLPKFKFMINDINFKINDSDEELLKLAKVIFPTINMTISNVLAGNSFANLWFDVTHWLPKFDNVFFEREEILSIYKRMRRINWQLHLEFLEIIQDKQISMNVVHEYLNDCDDVVSNYHKSKIT